MNPYEAPQASHETKRPPDEGLLAQRNEHLPVEAAIRAFGLLDLLGGGIAGVISLMSAIILMRRLVVHEAWRFFATNTLLAGVLVVTGISVLGLRPGGRVLQVAVFVVFAYGTMNVSRVGGLCVTAFWAVVIATTFFSRKAHAVFAPHYREVVIPATPLPLGLGLLGRVVLMGLAAAGSFIPLYVLFQPAP